MLLVQCNNKVGIFLQEKSNINLINIIGVKYILITNNFKSVCQT